MLSTVHSLLLVMVAVVAVITEKSPLLINKCCPIGQQLNDWLRECIELPEATPHNSTVMQMTVREMRKHLGEEAKFPSWMDSDTEIYSKESDRESSEIGFLQNASQDAIVRFGNRPCDHEDTQFIITQKKWRYKLFSNGSLLLNVFKTNGNSTVPDNATILLPPEEWCVDAMESASDPLFALLTCPCQRIPCVSRCCFPGALYVIDHKRWTNSATCQRLPNVTDIAPAFYNGRCPVSGTAEKPENVTCQNDTRVDVTYTNLVAYQPSCRGNKKQVLLNTQPSEILRLWLQVNGSVVLEDFGRGRAFPRNDSCIERGFFNSAEESKEADTALFCHSLTLEEAPTAEDVYYSLLFLLGGVFLALTLAVHAAIPDLRRTAHAKALCCHCAALLVASVTLAGGHIRRRLPPPYCSLVAYVVQFSFLATFFWLNVMCIDLSWSFTVLRRHIPGQQKRSRRFLYYSLYGWGSPALITAITLFVEYAPESIVDPSYILLPNIAVSSCWFARWEATLAYYYVPIALLLVCNLALFAMTVLRIRIARRGTSILRKGSDNARAVGGGGGRAHRITNAGQENKTIPQEGDKELLVVFTKLFLLMGVTWLTELASWVVNDNAVGFFYLTDAINLLRGIVIFVLFCCKPSVVKPMKVRLRSLFLCCGGRCSALDESSGEGNVTGRNASVSTVESGISLSDASAAEKQPEPLHETAEATL